MASKDYHTNDFIVKTITALRIIAGVAVTLAVLFAMVWLIDYSSERPAPSYNQQPLLFPDQGADDQSKQTRTYFESLLKTETEDTDDGVADAEKKPGSKPRPHAAQRSSGGQVSEDLPFTGKSEQARGTPSPQPAQSKLRSAQKSPVDTDVFAVQLGSFQQAERARIFSENLAAKGYQPYIVSSRLRDGTLTYRVRVGRFATREEAMNLAVKIERSENLSVFVTSR